MWKNVENFSECSEPRISTLSNESAEDDQKSEDMSEIMIIWQKKFSDGMR